MRAQTLKETALKKEAYKMKNMFATDIIAFVVLVSAIVGAIALS